MNYTLLRTLPLENVIHNSLIFSEIENVIQKVGFRRAKGHLLTVER